LNDSECLFAKHQNDARYQTKLYSTVRPSPESFHRVLHRFTYELVHSPTKLVTVQPFPFSVLRAGGLSGDVKNYLFQKQVISPCQKIQEAL